MTLCSTLAVVALVASGCSMFEPSTYENRITVRQRLIRAGNVEASAIKNTGTKGSGHGEPVEAIH